MGDLITEKVIGAAIEVHRQLGPGLLESTYERCFAKELDLRKIRYERQKICNLLYKGLLLEEGFRTDLLVENEVILEIKSVNKIAEIHDAQLLTHLRLLNLRRGLILNFNVPVLKAGIKRFSSASDKTPRFAVRIFFFALAKKKISLSQPLSSLCLCGEFLPKA